MKKYENPKWEIIVVEDENVIRTSLIFDYDHDDEDDWGKDPWD